jgi:site-specific DNA-methyltransferase (adenine-specific)
MINILHGDCMDLMASKPDNYYDLAIVDPPYGINKDGQNLSFNGNKRKSNRKHFANKGWDSKTPD